MYIATACTYTYFPGEQYPPPKKNKGGPPSAGTTSGEPGRSSARGDAANTAPGHSHRGCKHGGATGVGSPRLGGDHRSAANTDRGTQTEGRVANVTKGMRPVRYGQRTLVSVVEPLSGQPSGPSVGKGSSYAATDSYGDESSRQRTFVSIGITGSPFIRLCAVMGSSDNALAR